MTADSYTDDLDGSSLKVSDIIKWLKEADVRKSLLLLDACREKFQEKKSVNLNGLTAARFTQAEVGAVFYSTRSGWFSYEDKQGDFGVFSRFVIEGLKGMADSTTGNKDGIVSFFELSSYVDEEVAGWALKESKKQRPYTQILGEKYGDLALSAYAKATVQGVPGEPGKKEEEKPKVAKVEENVPQKEEKIKGTTDDKPAEVKAVEAKALRVYKNDKDFWEADYGDDIIMVYIPAGEFTMGSDDGDNDEKPMHNVYLDGYWMGKTEVTVGQFRIFLNNTGYETEPEKNKIKVNWENPGFTQEDNYPVVLVSWNDAVAYCKWLSKTKGITFTLPTEAQWEKGARGIDGRKYPWGDHKPYNKGKWYANYKREENTMRVGSYPQGASPYGLLDMAGNVWELCNDWYDSGYYLISPLENPTGPDLGTDHVVRGGGWGDDVGFLSCMDRLYLSLADRSIYVGFRLAQVAGKI